MALQFPCPSCKRELSGPESIAGSEVQCPSCRTVFLAGDGRGPRGTGIASERTPLSAMPPAEVRTPYRQRSPDDDRPQRSANAPEGRSGYWFGLLALLVFTPLALIGITTWILIGNRGVTSAPPVRMKPMAKDQVDWKDKDNKWDNDFARDKN
jgi:Zn-finger nucleic acid-binding protein